MDINLVTPATAPCVTADNLLEASRSSRPARRWESPQPSTMPMYHPGSRHIAAGLSTSRVVTSIYTADVRLLSSLSCLVECARSGPSSNARTWPAGPTTVLCLPLTPILVYAPEIVIPGNLSHHQPEPARARGPTQDARQLATSPHAIMADKEYRIQGFRNELQQYWCHPAASGRPQLDPIPDADLLRPVRHRESNSSLHPRRSVRP